MKKRILKITALFVIITLICTLGLSCTLKETVTEDVLETQEITEQENEVVIEKQPEEQPQQVKEEVHQKDPEVLEIEEQQDKLTCTLSVRCDIILQNIDLLQEEKRQLVPKDGFIYKEQEVGFKSGDSVFDVLLRQMREHGIHLEYEMTPIYNTAYVKGIGNLYEFDLGGYSGWQYKVNGETPNYGCSDYKVAFGDKIEWVYTK